MRQTGSRTIAILSLAKNGMGIRIIFGNIPNPTKKRLYTGSKVHSGAAMQGGELREDMVEGGWKGKFVLKKNGMAEL